MQTVQNVLIKALIIQSCIVSIEMVIFIFCEDKLLDISKTHEGMIRFKCFFQSRQNNELEQCVNDHTHVIYITRKMNGPPNTLSAPFSSSPIGGQYVGMCVFHKPSC